MIAAGQIAYAKRFGWARRVRVMRVMRTRALVAAQVGFTRVDIWAEPLACIELDWRRLPEGGNGLSRVSEPSLDKAEHALASFEADAALRRARRRGAD